MNKELVVTKANKLVEASYRLNVSEQRVMALLVTQIHPDDEDFKPYRFTVADLEALIETKNNKAYREVQELTRGLIKKVLQIQEPDGLLQVSWLSSAKYYDGTGTVELKFAPEMMPYLLQIQDRFTSYKLRNVIKLRSRYSVRLYELLKQYESLGKRSFELAELRRILGLADGELHRWQDFRRKVLDVALRELSKKTDLGFSYTVRKRGRAVGFVDFTIWHVDRDGPEKKAKEALPKSEALHKQAERCYRENNYGTACDVEDLKAFNELPQEQQVICRECSKYRNELLDVGAA